jgi:hypothetical protein
MLRRRHRSVLALALAALVAGWHGLGAAREQARWRERVLVLVPESPTPLEHELVTRLAGELGAAGIEVVRLPLPPGSDPAALVATHGSELGAVAAYATREEASREPASAAKTLRLWLADRVTGTVLAEAVRDADASSLASSLAVQGFELLQAREAEWRWLRTAAQPPAPPVAPSLPPPTAPPVAARLTAAMQLGLLLDAASGGSALTPMARVSYEPSFARGLGALDVGERVSLAGFGAPTVLDAAARRVDVVQSFALLEGMVALDGSDWLHAFATAGAGAYHVDVNGIGGGELVGRSEATLSPLGSAGLGLELQPWRHWIGLVEAQALFALHPTAVEAEQTRAATFGRTLLVFSLGLGVTW